MDTTHTYVFFFLNHKCSGEQNILNIKSTFADNKASCELKSVCVYFPVPWKGPGLLDSPVYTSGEVCLQGDCRTGGSCRHVAVHFQRLTCCGKAPFSSCLLEWCVSSAVRAAACWKWAAQAQEPSSCDICQSNSEARQWWPICGCLQQTSSSDYSKQGGRNVISVYVKRRMLAYEVL